MGRVSCLAAAQLCQQCTNHCCSLRGPKETSSNLLGSLMGSYWTWLSLQLPAAINMDSPAQSELPHSPMDFCVYSFISFNSHHLGTQLFFSHHTWLPLQCLLNLAKLHPVATTWTPFGQGWMPVVMSCAVVSPSRGAGPIRNSAKVLLMWVCAKP